MRKVWMVMRREYLATVKTKMFWVGTLAIPLGIVALIALSIAAQFMKSDKQRTLVVIDQLGVITAELQEDLGSRKFDNDKPRFLVEEIAAGDNVGTTIDDQKPRVLSGEVYALIHAGSDIDAKDNFRVFRKSVGDESTQDSIRDAINNAVRGIRLERGEFNLSRADLATLMKRVSVEGYQVREDGGSDKKHFVQALAPTFMFVVILFMTLYMYGYSMARGVIQEKSTKVMEVLLGSLSPEQLMAGKIFGIGLVGLTQIGIYGIVGNLLRVGAMSAAKISLPPMVADTIIDTMRFSTLGWFLIFFILGYFLFTGLFAIVGAVCSTEQDAQSLQFPVMMCLMLPYMMTFFFVQQPDSTAAVVSSLIPVFTPMVMFMRINVLMPPMWQILLSIVLMIISIYIVNRAAAKVFRVGTLMTGKRPGFGEILRWVRS